MANRDVQTPMANTKATNRLSQEPVSIFKRPVGDGDDGAVENHVVHHAVGVELDLEPVFVNGDAIERKEPFQLMPKPLECPQIKGFSQNRNAWRYFTYFTYRRCNTSK